jgi:GT2 family glycosyltransferase
MTSHEWLERFDAPTNEERARLRQSLVGLKDRPLISIILPIYNCDRQFLDRAIESVRRQIYEHWEICIADDASTDPQVRPCLEHFARSDARIKVHFRETNGHISACSNSALALASGEWCALLDQDDELAENALAEVACEIVRHPDAGIVYSDEDFLDANGVRSNPFFKPDWNPELFLGQNYLNHLGAYRTSLLREIGGFREGFEGSQDYDLALRCVARLRSDQIRHIPRILYHWRMIKGSLADQPDAKPYARHAARRALSSFLSERGINARAEACPENAESHRVIYALPAEPKPVTVLLAKGEETHFLEQADYPRLEIVHTNAGAAEANAGAKRAKGEILLFLSGEIQSAEVGWLGEIVSQIVRPEVGAVGARLWSAEGKLEAGGFILGVGGLAAPFFRGIPRGHPGYFNRAWIQQDLSAVSAACLAVRTEVFRELNGFDDKNLPQHFYDIDFCLRLRQRALRVIWTPYANLTFSSEKMEKDSERTGEEACLRELWSRQLEHDPFYNPNLSLALPGFALACPPRLPELG